MHVIKVWWGANLIFEVLKEITVLFFFRSGESKVYDRVMTTQREREWTRRRCEDGRAGESVAGGGKKVDRERQIRDAWRVVCVGQGKKKVENKSLQRGLEMTLAGSGALAVLHRCSSIGVPSMFHRCSGAPSVLHRCSCGVPSVLQWYSDEETVTFIRRQPSP